MTSESDRWYTNPRDAEDDDRCTLAPMELEPETCGPDCDECREGA